MTERVNVGKHELWYEQDTGLVHECFRGEMTSEELLRINEIAAKWVQEATPGKAAFLLIDTQELTSIAPDLPQAMAKLSSMVGERYVAYFGLSFSLRTIINMVLKGLSLVSGRSLTARNIILHFTADEAEARAWLTERKRDYAARNA